MESPPGADAEPLPGDTSWPQLKELVADLLELEPAAREALLTERCADVPALRTEAESLLAAAVRASDFLEHPMPSPTAVQPLAGGTVCGRYRIERLIGEGGFSEVYLAHQDEPFPRRVALKVLKPGMDSRALLQRFALERRTLARLEHPGIARILDAGATAHGRPFVVTEFVDGAALIDFAERSVPPLATRLALFLEICAAVEHAHQRGVIHRDLKPGNILVASDEHGQPHAKVIDFGIAKVLAGDDQERTGAGLSLCTPAYASPEQSAGDAGDVDTRADVFALGIVLAELCTGARWPSAAGPLPTGCPRELAWIARRATAPERERRYASVAALRDDVRAFLTGEALQAGPPTRAYRLRMFARRHRRSLAAVAFVVLVLASGSIAATIGMVQADAARREAEAAHAAAEAARHEADATADYLAQLISATDPARQGRDVKVVDLLDASRGLLERAGDAPDVAARLHHVVGRAYIALGEFASAEPHLRAAERSYSDRHGELDWRGIDAACDLVSMLSRAGRVDDAAAMIEVVDGRARRARGDDHPRAWGLTDLRAKLAFDRGRPTEAEAPLRELLRMEEARGPSDGVITLLGNLAQVLLAQSRHEEALPLATRGRDLCVELHGPDDPRTFAAVRKLAAVHVQRQDHAAVIDLLLPIRPLAKERLGHGHPDVLGVDNYLAYALTHAGRRDEAAAIYRQLVPLQQQKLAPLHPQAVMTLFNYGSLVQAQGNAAMAEPLLRDAFGRFRQLRGDRDRDTLRARLALARCILDQGRGDEVREAAVAVHEALLATFGDDDAMTREARRLLDDLPAPPNAEPTNAEPR